MDASTILAFAGLGTTTLVAVVSPYIGSRAGAKQEHRRWVREERFRAYEEALTYVQTRRLLLLEAVGKGLDHAPAPIDDSQARLAVRVEIYAAPAVVAAWHEFVITQREILRSLPVEHDQRLFQLAQVESTWDDLQSAVCRDRAKPDWSVGALKRKRWRPRIRWPKRRPSARSARGST